MSFLSALGKGLGSAIGGLFGRKKKATTNTINYVALRDAAEAAGFNPLAALRAGGGPGFMTTHHPTLGSREFIGEALGRGIDSYFSHDPREDKKAELETKILEAELYRLQKTNEYYDKLGVPTATAPLYRTTSDYRGFGMTKGEATVKASDSAPDGVHARPVVLEPERQYPARAKVTVGDTTLVGPNPDVTDTGINELLGSLLIYGPQWVGGIPMRFKKRKDRHIHRYKTDPKYRKKWSRGPTIR